MVCPSTSPSFYPSIFPFSLPPSHLTSLHIFLPCLRIFSPSAQFPCLPLFLSLICLLVCLSVCLTFYGYIFTTYTRHIWPLSILLSVYLCLLSFSIHTHTYKGTRCGAEQIVSLSRASEIHGLMCVFDSADDSSQAGHQIGRASCRERV